jgi:hypothetical protein
MLGTARDFGAADMLVRLQGAERRYNIPSLKTQLDKLSNQMGLGGFGTVKVLTPWEADAAKAEMETYAKMFVSHGFPDPLSIEYDGPIVKGVEAYNSYLDGNYLDAARTATNDAADAAIEGAKSIVTGITGGIILIALGLGAVGLALYYKKGG